VERGYQQGQPFPQRWDWRAGKALEFLADPLGRLYLGTAIGFQCLEFQVPQDPGGEIADAAPVTELARYQGECSRNDHRTATATLAASHR
jgi:hypothetical protein